MSMIPLHLRGNKKSDYDDFIRWFCQMSAEWIYSVFFFKKKDKSGFTRTRVKVLTIPLYNFTKGI